ncbi:Dihydropteroate synthase [Neolewinella maritima]|uniref:dihydropteroate synthase n=1 Tax=Neolewinella maritima TaxID=1383882 RepID=A0ABM9AYR1_9BACT|nr:dihydropteroate synthase [Neolewinella maritima]CAH0999438.1 Dihydropteroate synthase [Neolewinella maritima]
MPFEPFSLNCNGYFLRAERPLVMGILNATPDSFFAGSRVQADQVGAAAGAMVEAGAKILDVGGMSTRPGAELITSEEEQSRILPVIEAVRAVAPKVVISCDTVYAATARAAVAAGAGMINDVSAGRFDDELLAAVAELRVPYVLMHMPAATPATMQQHTQDYGDKVVTHVWDFLAEQLIAIRQLGVLDIIVDPGFGFGKNQAQNYTLLKNLHAFRHLGVPVLAGISRKGMVYKPLKTTPAESLPATAALHLYALQQGASILRVHDVKEGVEVVKLWSLLEEARLVGEG